MIVHKKCMILLRDAGMKLPPIDQHLENFSISLTIVRIIFRNELVHHFEEYSSGNAFDQIPPDLGCFKEIV